MDSTRPRVHCRWRQTVAILLLCSSSCLLTTSRVFAGALDREVEFHIDGGSLEFALIQLSQQASLPIALKAHAADNLKSSGLAGRLTVGTALTTLLLNSGLSYIAIGDSVTVLQSTSAETNRTTHPATSQQSPLP